MPHGTLAEIAVIGRHKTAHLIFELREDTEVMHPALLVECCHRLGSSELAAGGAHRREGHVRIDHAQRRLDHLAAVVHLSDNPVGAPDVYLVTKDQRHVDGKADGAAPLEPGQSGDYTITFPDGLTVNDLGLVVLTLGDVNWGALGPKVVQH